MTKKSPQPFLPYGRQKIDTDDITSVTNVLTSDFLTTGPTVDDFEVAFAEKIGAKHAVACSSGTAGLHIAAMALELTPDCFAVVPTLTFLATANVVRFVGAEVVFSDVSVETGLMRPEDLELTLNGPHGSETKAVFPVHLNGQCADMVEISRLALKQDLAVVEDACHALGTCYYSGGKRVSVGACQHSDMTVFSLHPVKTITAGEGGIVATNDDTLYSNLKVLRNQGIIRNPELFQHKQLAFDTKGHLNPWYYEMHSLGLNYRASDIHCALGLSQLNKLDSYVKKRHYLSERYDALLSPLAPYVKPVTRVPYCDPVLHLYVILIAFDKLNTTRSEIMSFLTERGIGTQVHYLPVSKQPYYEHRYGAIQTPGADAYYASCLTLPLHTSMQDVDVDHVVSSLKSAIHQNRN